MPWKNQYIGNPFLSGVARLFFHCPAHDLHCGIRAFSKIAYVKMKLKAEGMEFATEMVVSATLRELNIAEIPANLRPDGRTRKPHLRPWRDGWRHLRLMLLLSPDWLFLKPGLFLILVGSLFGGRLLIESLSFGFATLHVHTVIYALATIFIGLQSIAFSILRQNPCCANWTPSERLWI